ncbi:Rpn family recombination-promoting nuclease/putative transposase [Spirosoma sp. KUDC1026]|uniref:Rpn family recombination-promoting nuclease/putative transposase n=1 Tax=Spirosoma sp. KUDC1026 TaxID=2745947 RepID=UPI00159BBA95|nr:Rpn family recombination-promoting nuclease/putative transposase [Spirosoma sp. KUDC1026]QKZ14573.1 Rpn family recombination-promoting nuclease/putative transposase [Spirosoma sp. KUDC1026]
MAIESIFINPFTDYGFKRLFGTEANKDLLIDFLNQFLPDQHQIADLRYARNEQLGANEMDRKAVFDVYCVSHTGDRFIVELQKAQQLYFKDRSIFYASFPIQEQGQTGNWDFKLTAVYTVAILNFVLAENGDAPDVVSIVQLKDQHGRLFYDKLTFVYLEMPKFTKSLSELETKADKWQYLFNNLSRLQERPTQMEEPIFQRLFEAAEVANFSKAERERYEQSLKSYRDLQNVLSFTEMKALEKGDQRGFERGIQQGMREGEEIGKKEQAVRIARNALANGLSIELVATLTGLSEDEIRQLTSNK